MTQSKPQTKDMDCWQTPQDLFDKLHKQYRFDIDCCATSENTKVNHFCKDFLNLGGKVLSCGWMNPPFSKAYDMFRQFFRTCNLGVAIYRCDNMETKVWQDVILKYASWILIPKGRVSYEGMNGKGSGFPSALIGYNVEPPNNITGKLMLPK